MAVSEVNTHTLLSLVLVTIIYRALTMVGISNPEMRGHMGGVCSHTNATVVQIGTRASVDFIRGSSS